METRSIEQRVHRHMEFLRACSDEEMREFHRSLATDFDPLNEALVAYYEKVVAASIYFNEVDLGLEAMTASQLAGGVHVAQFGLVQAFLHFCDALAGLRKGKSDDSGNNE